MEISTDPALLSVQLPSESLTTSPSISTFLPEEEASTCPLLSATPSPPPLGFIHPLTQAVDDNGIDNVEETSSTDSSGLHASAPGALFSKHAYQHLGKNGDSIMQENGVKQNGTLPSAKTPGFVSWNWVVIRKVTFWVVMSAILAACSAVVAMVATLPRSCNPASTWYQGSVFYEIFPASFQDSNSDGIGDLRGLTSRANYIHSLGVSAIRINSIFPSEHYPDHFQRVTTLMDIDPVLGTKEDFDVLVAVFHARNVSVVLDLPIYPLYNSLEPVTHPISVQDEELNGTDHNPSSAFLISQSLSRQVLKDEGNITKAIRYWLTRGVDGFYLKGMENLVDDPNFTDCVAEWKAICGPDRILIIDNRVIRYIAVHKIVDVLSNTDLVDVILNVNNNDTEQLEAQINSTLTGIMSPEHGFWVHWSLGNVETRRISSQLSSNATLAVTLMQLMLPGTSSIFYGDEIALQESHDPDNDHLDNRHLHHLPPMAWNTSKQFTNEKNLKWIPGSREVSFEHSKIITRMIQLRSTAPSLYKNAISKDERMKNNYKASHSADKKLLILERWYPRRNTYASLTNMDNKGGTWDLSSIFYSGYDVLKVQNNPDEDPDKIYFKSLYLNPYETLIFKLDK